jgi:hypothetical protein
VADSFSGVLGGALELIPDQLLFEFEDALAAVRGKDLQEGGAKAVTRPIDVQAHRSLVSGHVRVGIDRELEYAPVSDLLG